MLAALLLSALLDVPYVAQTPELCGGAAVAMVMRYWGARDVFPQDFAPLVSTGDAGILTGTLTAAVRDRGWQALVVPAGSDDGPARIQSELNKGRPLIALIEVSPRTYHYVVIVGSTAEDIVMHDPARAPYRVLHWAEFDRMWSPAGRWMMLVLPPSGFRRADEAARIATAPADIAVRSVTPCTALVDRGVRMALDGDADGAERALTVAMNLCPDDPAPRRELAGLRFSQSRWPAARDFALSAIRLAPDDAYSWQLVATSRYLMGDSTGALDAWNHSGEPRLDAIGIQGATRTPQPVIIRAAGLQPRQLLTAATLELARRRVSELPVAMSTRVTYEPVAGGLAKADIRIDERALLPHGWFGLASLGARAVLHDEVRIDVAGPLRAGDLETVAWRWSPGRPRVAFSLATPSPRWLPGVVSFDASWDRQTYASMPSLDPNGPLRDTRRRAGLRVADWATGWFRWEAGAALDRFDTRDYVAAGSTLDLRAAADRIAVSTSAQWWTPIGGGNRMATAELRTSWRSTGVATRPRWSASGGVTMASEFAPLALWPGAGTGQGRSGLLRAHTLLHDGVLDGPVFGRRLAQGSIEYARPVALAGTVSIAGFVDGARAWQRMTGLATSPLYVDAGIGLRIQAPGERGAFRLDLAHGLRGGGTTLSADWLSAWPR